MNSSSFQEMEFSWCHPSLTPMDGFALRYLRFLLLEIDWLGRWWFAGITDCIQIDGLALLLLDKL